MNLELPALLEPDSGWPGRQAGEALRVEKVRAAACSPVDEMGMFAESFEVPTFFAFVDRGSASDFEVGRDFAKGLLDFRGTGTCGLAANVLDFSGWAFVFVAIAVLDAAPVFALVRVAGLVAGKGAGVGT